MAINKELNDRLARLENQINKRKVFISFIINGPVLKRDLVYDEIEVIETDESITIDQFILIDLFGLEDWNTEIENNPEKCWLLEHMYPGKTARAAWRKETRKYNDSIPKYVEPKGLLQKNKPLPNDDKPMPILTNNDLIDELSKQYGPVLLSTEYNKEINQNYLSKYNKMNNEQKESELIRKRILIAKDFPEDD